MSPKMKKKQKKTAHSLLSDFVQSMKRNAKSKSYKRKVSSSYLFRLRENKLNITHNSDCFH